MHIRFGHYRLGKWKCDCGEMDKHRLVIFYMQVLGSCDTASIFSCRNIGDGWYEMTCTLSIDADILKHPVAYKYIVYAPKMEKEDDCYEYLHGYGGFLNRCLRIPQNKFPKLYGGRSVCLYLHDCVIKLALAPLVYFVCFR